MCQNLLIKGLQGLGDGIYQRPFVRSACEQSKSTVYLKTPWPQLYWDLAQEYDLRFLKWGSRLRTQSKNEDRFGSDVFHGKPCCSDTLRLAYGRGDLRDGLGILGGMTSAWPYDTELDLSFKPKPKWVREAMGIVNRPFVLLRPPTIRTEWRNEARNPCLTALQTAVDELRKTHLIVSVADLLPGEEWLDEPHIEGVDVELHEGQLSADTMIGLAALADMLVGGPGFIVPLGIALQVPTFVVFGGYHKPADLINPELVNADYFNYVAPEPFCDCYTQDHECNKSIEVGSVLSAVRATRKEKAMA